MLKKISPLLLAAATSAVAGRPVATITSADEFTLSGVHISAPAVSSWPLMVGDEIKGLAAPAAILFTDNTLISVAKGSSLKLESEGGRIIVRLTGGSMTYKLGHNSTIRVFALDHPIDKPQEGISVKEGNVNFGNHTGPSLDPPSPPSGKLPGRSQGE
jgi:hypothetical protein